MELEVFILPSFVHHTKHLLHHWKLMMQKQKPLLISWKLTMLNRNKLNVRTFTFGQTSWTTWAYDWFTCNFKAIRVPWRPWVCPQAIWVFDKISVKVTTMVWLALIVRETYMYVQMRMLKKLEKHILQDVSHLVTQTQ
jgi:hypothetical protein